MDVSITNGLEGVRQYFQGLPAATVPTRDQPSSPPSSYNAAVASAYSSNLPVTPYLPADSSTTKKWPPQETVTTAPPQNEVNARPPSGSSSCKGVSPTSETTGSEPRISIPEITPSNPMQPSFSYPGPTSSHQVFSDSVSSAANAQQFGESKPAVPNVQVLHTSQQQTQPAASITKNVVPLPTHEMRPHSHEIWQPSYEIRPSTESPSNIKPDGKLLVDDTRPTTQSASSENSVSIEGRLSNPIKYNDFKPHTSSSQLPSTVAHEVRPVNANVHATGHDILLSSSTVSDSRTMVADARSQLNSYRLLGNEPRSHLHDSRPVLTELTPITVKRRPSSVEHRPQSQDAKLTTLETRPASHEFRSPFHEMRPPSHEMRPPSHEMRPSSNEIKPPSHEMRLPPHDIGPLTLGSRSPSHDLSQSPLEIRTASHDIRQQSHEIRPASHEIRQPSHEVRPTSHEIRTPSHEIRPLSHDYRPSSIEMRPQAQEMRPSSHGFRSPSQEYRSSTNEYLRIQSTDTRPASRELRSPLVDNIRPPSHEIRPTSVETTRPTLYEMRPPSTDVIRPPSHEMRSAVHDNRSLNKDVNRVGSVDQRQLTHNVPSMRDSRFNYMETNLHGNMDKRGSDLTRPQDIPQETKLVPNEFRTPTSELRTYDNTGAHDLRGAYNDVRLPSHDIRTSFNDIRPNFNPTRATVNESRVSNTGTQPNPTVVQTSIRLEHRPDARQQSRETRLPYTDGRLELRSQESGYLPPPSSDTNQRVPYTPASYSHSVAESHVTISPSHQKQQVYYPPQLRVPTTIESHSTSQLYHQQSPRTATSESSAQQFARTNFPSTNTQFYEHGIQNTQTYGAPTRPISNNQYQVRPSMVHEQHTERKPVPYGNNSYQMTARSSSQPNIRPSTSTPQNYSPHTAGQPTYTQNYAATQQQPQQLQIPESRESHQTYHQLQPVVSQQQQHIPHGYQPSANYAVPARNYYPSQASTTTSQTYLQTHPQTVQSPQQPSMQNQKSHYPSYPTTSQATAQQHLPIKVPNAQPTYNPSNNRLHESHNFSAPTQSVQKTTHNLPPIAALSSVNYLSNKSGRDVLQRLTNHRHRQQQQNTQKAPLPFKPSVTSAQQMPAPRPSMDQAQRTFKYPPQSTPTPVAHYGRANPAQNYPYVTTIAQSRFHTTTTSSNQSGPAASPVTVSTHHHQSSHVQAQQHPPVKPALQEALIKRQQLNQQNAAKPTPNHSTTNSFVRVPLDLQTNHNGQLRQETAGPSGVTPAPKLKRESPLDLSVKTVRTTADSTAGDDMHTLEHRNVKNNSLNSRSMLPPQIPSYVNYDNHSNNHLRTTPLRAPAIPSATAPKVDFSPNFSASQLTPVSRYSTTNQKSTPTPRIPYENALYTGPTSFQHPYKKQVPQNKLYDNRTAYYQATSHHRFANTPANHSGHSGSFVAKMESSANRAIENLPRVEFPPQSHSQETAQYNYTTAPKDAHRKRLSDPTALPSSPSKVPRVDNWRESIDQQIEQRFKSYTKSRAQEENQQHTTPSQGPSASNQPMVNGHTPPKPVHIPKEPVLQQRMPSDNLNPVHPYTHHPVTTSQNPTHPHTYVPTPGAHHQFMQHELNTPLMQSRSNSYGKLPHGGMANHSIPNSVGPGADKRVLSILRNSLEIKGAKEAQKRIEQEQMKPAEPTLGQIRPIFQQPTTGVSTPVPPKLPAVGRHSVPPFATAGALEHNSNTPPSKYHLPRAVDSVPFDTESLKKNCMAHVTPEMYTDTRPSQVMDLATIMAFSHNLPANADLDGLAANLAARIRTKAELKQVDPTQLRYNKANNESAADEISSSPNKTESCSEESNLTVNLPIVPKLIRERLPIPPPRRRLLSRTEDDQQGVMTAGSAIPPRDTSLRSSSETSVFDFRDSDSEGELAGLERQSLEAMRRDRKSVPKPLSMATTVCPEPANIIKDEPIESPDPFFMDACDKFVEQLRTGGGKKRGRRKKVVEPEAISKLETVTKESPLIEVEIKVEKCDDVVIKTEKEDDVKKEVTEQVSEETACVAMSIKVEENDSDSDVPLIRRKVTRPADVKKTPVSNDEDDLDISKKRERSGAKIKLESSSDSSSDSENEGETKSRASRAETVADRLRQRKCRSLEKRSESESGMVLRARDSTPQKSRSKSALQKKPSFGDGSDFRPGWEEEVYKYKQSLRMPEQLINISRPARLSTSLPDLDPCPSPAASSITDSEFCHQRRSVISNLFGSVKVKREFLDSDIDSNSSFTIIHTNKIAEDSEEATSSSIISSASKSASKQKDNNNSIVDVLAQRYGKNKRKKLVKKELNTGPKVIPKSSNPLELLPTPGLGIGSPSKEDSKFGKKRNKKSESILIPNSDAALLGFFRKKTVNNFRDAFRKNTGAEAFTPIVFKSRTRKETLVLKQRATIREVFGEERPASAPPMAYHTDTPKPIVEEPVKKKKASPTKLATSKSKKENAVPGRAGLRSAIVLRGNRTILKTKRQILKTAKKRNHTLLKPIAAKKIKSDLKNNVSPSKEEPEVKLSPGRKKIIRKVDAKPEITEVEPAEKEVVPIIHPTKRKYIKSMRRKFSSGFDYIRKKKKQVKKGDVDTDVKPKKRGIPQRASAESVQDIQREIKGWVLNKGIGETQLHRAARLGYTDVAAYCLETLGTAPSPKDNAGYTPLHEACSRGHLDIAKLLLLYGANVHESAQGGIRPLHEAVENGFVEIIRLLLSYGADPILATYSGHTPLSLALDEDTVAVIQNYLADIQGKDAPSWTFVGPANCFEPDEKGYDALESAPSPDPLPQEEDLDMEISEAPLPNLYTLRGDNPGDRWVLLQDLITILKVKSKDALLRQLNPAQANTSAQSTAPTNPKHNLKEMKMMDFLEQAHCCHLLSAGERVNTRASKITLVKYTDRVKQLLGVENMVIPAR